MLMYFVILILFPGDIFCVPNSEAKKQVFATKQATLEGQLIFNNIFKSTWEKITASGQSDPRNLKINANSISTLELVAAIHERLRAIDLNINCWHCSLYRKTQKPSSKNKLAAQKCAQVGKFMSWYNEAVTGTLFLGAWKGDAEDDKAPSAGNRRPTFDYNINELVKKTDGMLNKLQKMNEVFTAANLNYDNIFDKLCQAGVIAAIDKTRIEGSAADFFEKSFSRLFKPFDAEMKYAIVYYLLAVKAIHEVPSDFSHTDRKPNYDENTEMWKHIQKLEDLKAEYSQVPKILELEKTILLDQFPLFNMKPPTEITSEYCRIWKNTVGIVDYNLVRSKENTDRMKSKSVSSFVSGINSFLSFIRNLGRNKD